MSKQIKGKQTSHLHFLLRGNDYKARITKPPHSSYDSYILEISNCSLSLPERRFHASFLLYLSPDTPFIKAMIDYALNLVQQIKNLSSYECAFIEYACQDAIPVKHQPPSDYSHSFCEMIRITTSNGDSACFIIYRRAVPDRWLEVFMKYSRLMEAVGP